MDSPRGYVRISREDIKGSKEDTIDRHIETVQFLARRYGHTLTLEDISIEVESGGSLDGRPQVLELLEDCRRKRVTHLYVADLSRLSRGQDADWGAIKAALFAGSVTLVTLGSANVFNRKLDTWVLDLEAVNARQYRRAFGLRMTMHKESMVRKGHLMAGRAPYGYRWDSKTKTMSIEADEFEAAREIFRRAWTESTAQIARDLTQQYRDTGRPIPPGHKYGDRLSLWRTASVRTILGNPAYAGWPAKRSDTDMYGKVVNLAYEEWQWPDKEQEYPKILSLSEWKELQALIKTRTWSSTSPTIPGWLRDVLFCPRGGRMQSYGPKAYSCNCRQLYHVSHGASTITQHKAHMLAERYIEFLFSRMRHDDLPKPEQPKDTDVRRAYHAAVQGHEKAKLELSELVTALPVLLRTVGESFAEAKLMEAKQAVDQSARRESKALEAVRSSNAALPGSVVEAVRVLGFREVWNAMGSAEKHAVAAAVFDRIELRETRIAKGHVRFAEVTPHAWAQRIAPGGIMETV